MDIVKAPMIPLDNQPSVPQRRAILLTSYNTGAAKGKNLGIAGYSHDIVAKLYFPLLSRWGEVISVINPKKNLEAAVEAARQRNLDPVHVSIIPLQDVCLAKSAPNIVAPAWEFPDVPDHEFDDNPQNDWPATADRCTSLMVGGPFTLDAFKRAGTSVPIHIVPVPTPDAYFELPAWKPSQQSKLDYSAIVLPQQDLSKPCPIVPPANTRRLKRLGQAVERKISNTSKALVGRAAYKYSRGVTNIFRTVSRVFKKSGMMQDRRSSEFNLDGVVYTSIFNPNDGRKNWRDLLTAFLYALGDREDATLVVKLITNDPDALRDVVTYCENIHTNRCCRIIFVTDYLSEEQLCQLAQASTYYLQATKAEGNCLPLMNYLAAGRPGISPCHSAIADYFDDSVGFVVDSHAEPSAWPHDSRLRIRSTWARIVWPSLVEQIRASYHLAKSQPATYTAMAERARERMQGWASEEQVWVRLRAVLDAAVGVEDGVSKTRDMSRKVA